MYNFDTWIDHLPRQQYVMQSRPVISYLFLTMLSLTTLACFKEPNYSDTPEITSSTVFPYKNLPAQQGVGKGRRDSIIVTIGFKDGDGNLGNDTPVSRADSVRYASNGGWGNYKITTLRLVNGKYEVVPTLVNKTLFFPDLAKGKGKGAIEGTLDFGQIFTYGNRFQLYPIKFQIQIRDRNLNESNVIETDTVVVPYPR